MMRALLPGTSKNLLRERIAASLPNAKLAQARSPLAYLFDMSRGFAAGLLALRPLVTVFRAALLLLFSTAAVAQEVDTLPLRGQGVGTYLFFEVFDASLHAPPQADAARILAAETPKRLTLRYKLAIEKQQFVDASLATLRAQWPEAHLAKLKPALDSLHAAMRDVQPGDAYTLEYLPQRGLRLKLNGQPLWQGGDAALAEAYFGIWLNRPALSEPLRLALLGEGKN